ncbi:hypothetical protein Y032_0048g1701 [Ancylostoma ceylanicum]|uniref:Uncharacterized protein n=1 Tax=Ancylostoma ceylanicum TaxID=53326 RepID=A0A016UAS2_9BILA|nr:hypothetical protein Y032_0048g1701 [Ancylostoma ceylanicum]
MSVLLATQPEHIKLPKFMARIVCIYTKYNKGKLRGRIQRTRSLWVRITQLPRCMGRARQQEQMPHASRQASGTPGYLLLALLLLARSVACVLLVLTL